MQSKKKILVLIAAVATVGILLAATSASAYYWHDKAYIKVHVYGPTFGGFQHYDKVTVRISDTQGRVQTITHRISIVDQQLSRFTVRSSKSFYVDRPVTIRANWKGSVRTTQVSGRPMYNTQVARIYFR